MNIKNKGAYDFKRRTGLAIIFKNIATSDTATNGNAKNVSGLL